MTDLIERALDSDVAAPDGERGRGSESIGEGIRRERLRRGLTLAQLASPGEPDRQRAEPDRARCIRPVDQLAAPDQAAFDVPMFQFLIGTSSARSSSGKDRRTKLTFVDRLLEYELVSADTSGEFEVLSLSLVPGGSPRAP